MGGHFNLTKLSLVGRILNMSYIKLVERDKIDMPNTQYYMAAHCEASRNPLDLTSISMDFFFSKIK